MTATMAYSTHARLLERELEALSEPEVATLRSAADALLFGDDDADARLARAEGLLARLEDAGRVSPSRIEDLHVALRSIAPELACV
jgi:hypothetical protein